MKNVARIVLGICGLIGIYFGIQQIRSGLGQMSGRKLQPQELGERVTVGDHNCSLRVPKGWEQKPGEGGGTMYVAPKASGYVANFIVMSQPWAESLSQYAETNVTETKKAVPTAEIGAKSPFTLESGAESFKVNLKNKFNEVSVGQSMYFFAGPGEQKFVITSSAPTEQSADLEPFFDSCMKTFVAPAK